MPKFTFDGEEFEASRLDFRDSRLRIETDALVVAAIGRGGVFGTELEEGVTYAIKLPQGQLEFMFDPGYESVSVVFDLTGSQGQILVSPD